MTVSYAGIPVNPFDDDFVKEPRDVAFSVKGLNDAPLQKLLETFERLEDGPVPRRPVGAVHAQFVVSPERGYGKSHLLGRLFMQLGPRAVKVYLRPFEDPYKAWHSILQTTVDELRSTDLAVPGETLQIKSLALAVLARLAADLVQVYGAPGLQEPAEKIISTLRSVNADSPPPEAYLRKWIEWLMLQMSDLERRSRVVANLHKRGVDLRQREMAWLKVLAAQALDAPRGPKAWAATKWLRAEPLEPFEVRLLDLDEADNDGKGDCSPQELNGLSFQRLRCLCLLGSFHRPYVFCFDQTEAYADDVPLIRALGGCIEKGCVELKNQMTVLTANHPHWVLKTAIHMTPPHLDRLSPEIFLEGIGKEEARELITTRLAQCGLEAAAIELFFAKGWLDERYEELAQQNVRELIKAARARFRKLVGTPSHPRPTLAELFEEAINAVRAKRALLVYNQDALMWFVKDVGQGLAGVSIEWAPGHKYFSYLWRWPDRQVAFAFEAGTHWKKWQAMANEVTTLSEENPHLATLWYVLRTPDLEKVPRESWKQAKPSIEAARRHGLRVIGLTLDELCQIHAARELHSSALQGNIDYTAAETLAWLQKHFARVLQGLAQRQGPEVQTDAADGQAAAEGAPTELPALARELDENGIRIVTDLVREHRIIDIQTVVDRLGGANEPDAGLRDALLRSVERHPNLQAQPGPVTIYLRWLPAGATGPSSMIR